MNKSSSKATNKTKPLAIKYMQEEGNVCNFLVFVKSDLIITEVTNINKHNLSKLIKYKHYEHIESDAGTVF